MENTEIDPCLLQRYLMWLARRKREQATSPRRVETTKVIPEDDRPMFRRRVGGVCRLWLPRVTSRRPTSMDDGLKSGINLAPVSESSHAEWRKDHLANRTLDDGVHFTGEPCTDQHVRR